MKEIVIKLSDVMYERLIESKGFSPCAFMSFAEAVKNGKVLPKGHGELIDARAFLQSIVSDDYDTYNDYSNTVDWIEDAETLVEADNH